MSKRDSSDSDGASSERRRSSTQTVSNVTISVHPPSNLTKADGGDDTMESCNLGSDENLIDSDALNNERSSNTLNESHASNWNSNLGNLTLSFQEPNSNGQPVVGGHSPRYGANSLQLPFTIGRSSKDAESGSICTAQSNIIDNEKFDPRTSYWWTHPKVKENWRVFFAAFGLLLIGTGLIVMGIVVTCVPDIGFQSYVFFVAGAFCFIPGAYHVVYVYCAVKGRKGYDFYQLPLFN